MPFSLIVFDLDGTLIDSRRDIADSANTLLVECGAGPLPEREVGQMVGDGAPTLVARAFARSGIGPPPDALERFLRIYERRLLRHTRPYPGIPEALGALGRRATLAVLTNKPGRATRELLYGLDLERHFPPALVVAGDGPFARKPDPAGLVHLMIATGSVPEATVLVGDSLIDDKTARAASASICIARYGFGSEGSLSGAFSQNALAVDSPAQLVSRL